jgi:hypothetical protein
MTFTQLGLSAWNAQLTQAVGNAIAAASNLSASDVRLVDVRPFASGARRRLLQTTGVQAVFFARTADPDAVNTRLQVAASDGSFAKSLVAFGVPAASQPSVALKSYYGRERARARAWAGGSDGARAWAGGSDRGRAWAGGSGGARAGAAAGVRLPCACCARLHQPPLAPLPPPTPTPTPAAPPATRSFPLWALAPILVGVLALVAALVLGYSALRRCRGGPDHAEFAPGPLPKSSSKGSLPRAPSSAAGYANGGGGKDYHSARPFEAHATAAAVPAAPAPLGGELPVSRSVRVPSGQLPDAAPPVLSAPAAFAPAPLAAAVAPDVRPPAPIRTGAAGAPAAAAAAPQQQQWRTNVRPAAAVAAEPAPGAVSSMTSAKAKGGQQAERARFWAQFNETWQSVRETKQMKEDGGEPGTPSSGTAWTETTAGRR